MNITYSDLRIDILAYKVIDNVIYANIAGEVYRVDFSSFEDGEMINSDIIFIAKAYKENGEIFITLRKPVDSNGNEILQDDFLIDEYEDIEVNWKTQEEIEAENNKPKIPTLEERLQIAEGTILDLMTIISMGGM